MHRVVLHFEVLQWARKHGCSWDENTREAASENGGLEVLEWARGNGTYMCCSVCVTAFD